MRFFNNKRETETIEASPEQKQEMRLAEQEVEQRQYIEYHEKIPREIESQVALDKSLLSCEARLSIGKKIIPNMVKYPDGSLGPKAVEIEGDYPEIFSEDLIKGNYGAEETESVWGNALFTSFLMHLGESRGVDLKPAAKFFQVNEHLFIDISRGKNMGAAILTKTDKHVSEGMVQHVQQQLIEKKKKSWGFF